MHCYQVSLCRKTDVISHCCASFSDYYNDNRRERERERKKTDSIVINLSFFILFYCYYSHIYTLSHLHIIEKRKRKKKIRYATSPYSTVKWLIWCTWYRSDEKMNRYIDENDDREEMIERLNLIPILN